ncbi:MAG: hypothetical protein AB1486_02040 [Planctomycetota bacterium]
MLALALALALVPSLAPAAGATSQPPRLNFIEADLGRPRIHTIPRPYANRSNVTPPTTIYFEVVVPDANADSGNVDRDSITATILPAGGEPLPMVRSGQRFEPGFSGEFLGVIDSGPNNGEAVTIVPGTPLDPGRAYTIEVFARTRDGVPIDPARDSWTFTTRPLVADPTVTWRVDVRAPTMRWKGWFFTGITKPSFDTSRLFDQFESYALMHRVRATRPEAWSLQRDWPLTSDYWHNGVFDGNPNVVRERETRRVIRVRHVGGTTQLTVTDLEEGPLFGIPPHRAPSTDFHAGDRVTVADREKYEVAEVLEVDDASNTVTVTLLQKPPEAWELDYPGSRPPDNPEVPDNFTLPLCYLRKLAPPGTPTYYWRRLDDEWDIVHATYGRRLVVNFSYVPLDLAREPVPAHPGGHGSISPPKDWLQWHEFVRQTVFHIVDRYGAAAASTFYWSAGNENNFNIFWSGTKGEFYQLYDVTVNAVLTAFEDRDLETSRVQVGGIEAPGLGGIAWIRDALYHASGAADHPQGKILEENFVCSDPRFQGKRAARVRAITDAHHGKGSPLDFVSIHEYENADLAAADITRIRDDALEIDPHFYENLNVTSFEATPDWFPRADPAARDVFRGNGFFPTWCAEWTQRLIERAERDPRYARHEATLTVWPFDYNGEGLCSVTGLVRVDDDGDGTEDRVATIRKDVFNYIELTSRMSRDVAVLPAREFAGIRVAGFRSASPTAHTFLLYAHDKQDTESRDPTLFTVRLSLQGIPWPSVIIRRWRVDRDHSSPYRAYQKLARKPVYRPAEIASLESSDELAEDGPPLRCTVPGGELELSVPLAVNGVAFIELRHGQ